MADTSKPRHVEIAEAIARDHSCAGGEFHQRVLAIIPYLVPEAPPQRKTSAELMHDAVIRHGLDWSELTGRATEELGDYAEAVYQVGRLQARAGISVAVAVSIINMITDRTKP